MSRFKKGQTVYSGRGDRMKEMVVARVIDNGFVPVYQYTFEAPHDGFACGEQSIRATKDGRDLKLGECFKDNDNEMEVRVNTIASALRNEVSEANSMTGIGKLSTFDCIRVDFKPSLTMCEWLRDYAKDRLIIHVDSGQGHLVNMLKMVQTRAIGIEPNFNKQKWLEWRFTHRGGDSVDVNEILEGDIKRYTKLIADLGDKVVLVFARPKHNKSVHYAINKFMGKCEILLIGLPIEVEKDSPWKIIEHEGRSEDNELVYSLK